MSAVTWATHFIGHVDRESHHTEVVDDEDSFQVQRFAVLHYPRPKRHHKVNVHGDDDCLWEWRGHKEPVLCAIVCKKSTEVTGLVAMTSQVSQTFKKA